MHIQQDFAELLQLLEKHKVEYVIVGGYAVAFHGYPRFTKDIDVFYNNKDANVDKLQKVLYRTGRAYGDKLVTRPDNRLQIFSCR